MLGTRQRTWEPRGRELGVILFSFLGVASCEAISGASALFIVEPRPDAADGAGGTQVQLKGEPEADIGGDAETGPPEADSGEADSRDADSEEADSNIRKTPPAPCPMLPI